MKPATKKSALFRYPLYKILWDDAEGEAGWMEEPRNPMKPSIACSIGFLIREEPNYILLADSYFIDDATKIIGGTNKIPRGMVVEMEELKISTPRKKVSKIEVIETNVKPS